jgi:hypothetical protein
MDVSHKNDISNLYVLLLALGLALSFEVVNGFHDTASAVAMYARRFNTS